MAEDPGACGACVKELARRRRVDLTRRRFHWRVEAREISDGGVLGGDMTVVTGSIRWTGNLPDRANVAARDGAAVARGQTATTSRARGSAWGLRIG
jgi:hypothetical protein